MGPIEAGAALFRDKAKRLVNSIPSGLGRSTAASGSRISRWKTAGRPLRSRCVLPRRNSIRAGRSGCGPSARRLRSRRRAKACRTTRAFAAVSIRWPSAARDASAPKAFRTYLVLGGYVSYEIADYADNPLVDERVKEGLTAEYYFNPITSVYARYERTDFFSNDAENDFI